MASCNCCCEIVANYRGQRIAPRIGDGTFDRVSFVDWVNQNHKFNKNEYEREYSDSDEERYGQDAGGPQELQTDGNWAQVGFIKSASGGSITLSGIFSDKHSMRFLFFEEADQLPSFSYTAIGQTADGEVVENDRTLGELAPDSTIGVDGVPYSTEAQINDAKEEKTKSCILSSAGKSLCIRNQWFGVIGYGDFDAIEVSAWKKLDNDENGESAQTITVSAGPRHKGDYDAAVSTDGSEYLNGGQAFFIPTARNPSDLSDFGPYFNTPVVVRGEGVTLYRNGEVVLEAIRPSPAETLAATATDGSYLIVSEVSEGTNRPWTGVGIDRRRRRPRPFKQLASFVVDREGPVIGVSPPQDFFEDATTAEKKERVLWIAATKPISMQAYTAGTFGTKNDDNGVVRPITSLQGVGIGLTTVTPPSTVSHPFTDFRDRAGNEAVFIPTLTNTIHPVPPNNRRGARPRLEDVGLQTREYWRPRFQHEQVREVSLTWDRKVKADTVSADQLTLKRNGIPVSGCALEQVSDTRWRVTLSGVPQGEKEYWLLTYDPGGNVVTDDILTKECPTYLSFPPSESSAYKVVYVDKTTGFRYSKSPTGYVPIGNGPPLDENGIPYAPEPCVLATRTAWLMSSFDGWPEPEDAASRQVLIGTVPSITNVTTPPDDEGNVTIAADNGYSITDFGKHMRSTAADAFSPTVWVPWSSVEDNDCSYWGMKTTIDPCPPREVTECARPRAMQRHSSAIRSARDIQSITLSMVVRDESSGEEKAQIPPEGYPLETFPLWGQIGMSSVFKGTQLAQNIWAANVPGLQPSSYTNLLGTFTGTVLGGTVFLEAFRFATEYAGRRTAFLNELEFQVTCRYLVKTKIEPTELGEATYGKNPEDRYVTLSYGDRFAISKEKEAVLASGEPVYVPWKVVADTSQSDDAFWWKLQ